MIRHLTKRGRGERTARALAPRGLASCGHVLLAAALLSACSASAPAPRTLPDGPPPEYEAPRPFDMGGGAPTASPSAAPQAPEMAPPPSPSAPTPSAPSAAPSASAPPSPSAPR